MAGSKQTKPTKDLTPKQTGVVKGGKLAVNTNLTLVRAAAPKITKDLPPKHNPKGGKKKR